MCLQIIYIYLICMYKEDLALNNLQGLICHETKQNLKSVIKQNQNNLYYKKNSLNLTI